MDSRATRVERCIIFSKILRVFSLGSSKNWCQIPYFSLVLTEDIRLFLLQFLKNRCWKVWENFQKFCVLKIIYFICARGFDFNFYYKWSILCCLQLFLMILLWRHHYFTSSFFHCFSLLQKLFFHRFCHQTSPRRRFTTFTTLSFFFLPFHILNSVTFTLLLFWNHAGGLLKFLFLSFYL